MTCKISHNDRCEIIRMLASDEQPIQPQRQRTERVIATVGPYSRGTTARLAMFLCSAPVEFRRDDKPGDVRHSNGGRNSQSAASQA